MPETDLVQVCDYCQVEQPTTAFEICRIVGARVYRRRRCRRCKLALRHQRFTRLREWLIEYKKTLACCRCGFNDYRALTFHHREGDEKDFNVGDMLRSGFSQATVLREIQKCIVLCANCHHIEHFREQFEQQ